MERTSVLTIPVSLATTSDEVVRQLLQSISTDGRAIHAAEDVTQYTLYEISHTDCQAIKGQFLVFLGMAVCPIPVILLLYDTGWECPLVIATTGALLGTHNPICQFALRCSQSPGLTGEPWVLYFVL